MLLKHLVSSLLHGVLGFKMLMKKKPDKADGGNDQDWKDKNCNENRDHNVRLIR